MRGLILMLAVSLVGLSHAEDVRVLAAITGDSLSFNNQKTELGAPHWADPGKNWRTVGELMKTIVPPPTPDGQRPNVLLVVNVDEHARWGALKTLFMASSALGISRAQINHGAPGNKTLVALHGAKSKGDVVDFPLFPGTGSTLQTENGGRKMDVTPKLAAGLIKQLPKAVVSLKADPELSASGVVNVISIFIENNAAGVAFMPVEEITAKEAAERKEAKDSVDRAFEGGLGGLGK
jgi:hypothetical protein